MVRFPRNRLSIDTQGIGVLADAAPSVRHLTPPSVHRTSGVVIVRVPHVLAKTGMSRSRLYSLINPNSPYYDPTFPKKAVIGTGPRARTVGWRLHEIDAWLDGQFTEPQGGVR